jgi:hypothetical protein
MLKQNLEIIKGDNRTYTVTFNNQNGAIDITGWNVTFIIKKSVGSLNNILKKEITIHTNPTQGVTKIPLSSEETDKITQGKYYYLIKVITNKNEKFTVLAGVYGVKAV